MSPISPQNTNHFTDSAVSHRGALVAYAYGILRDWSLAEDALQDALVIAQRKWDAAREEAKIFPWLRGIVRLECLRILKQRRREVSMEEGQVEELLLDRWDSAWDDRNRRELERRMAALRRCLSHLSEAALNLLRDHYSRNRRDRRLEGLKVKGARRVQLFRIRQRLKKCVEDSLSEPETKDGALYDSVLNDYFDSVPEPAELRLLGEASLEETELVDRLMLDWAVWFGVIVERFAAEGAHGGVPGSPRMLRSQESSGARPVDAWKAKTRKRNQTRRLRFGAAAAVVLGAGWIAFRAFAPPPTIGTFEVRSGQVEIVSKRGSRIVEKSHPVRGDEQVVTGPSGSVALLLKDEETEFLVDPGTVAGFDLAHSAGKRVFLEGGRLTVTAAPQPTWKPLKLSTVANEFEVVGTTFTLSYLEESETGQLWVDEGKVLIAGDGGDRGATMVTGGEVASLNGAGGGDVIVRRRGEAVRETWYFGSDEIEPYGDYSRLLDGPPDRVDRVGKLGFERPEGEYYVQRIRGILYPGATGTYEFWVASDNDSSLQLDFGGGLEPVAGVPRLVAPSVWESFPEQKSKPVRLKAGRAYPFEVLYRQQSLHGFLDVSWKWDGAPLETISGEYISPP